MVYILQMITNEQVHKNNKWCIYYKTKCMLKYTIKEPFKIKLNFVYNTNKPNVVYITNWLNLR